MFNVGKGVDPDPEVDQDRGIIGRRQINWAELPVKCPPLAAVVQLTRLSLRPGEQLFLAVSDLPDYYPWTAASPTC